MGKLLGRVGAEPTEAEELATLLTVLEAAGVVHKRGDGSYSLRKGVG